jgi:hypothetical protein
MKKQTKHTGTYSLLISLLVLLFIALALAVVEIADFRYRIVGYVILGVAVSAGTFLIVRWFFVRYVEQNIRPIFKTIQAHNEVITVTSKVNEGTPFIFSTEKA